MSITLISVCLTKKPVSQAKAGDLVSLVEQNFTTTLEELASSKASFHRTIFLEWPVVNHKTLDIVGGSNTLGHHGSLRIFLSTRTLFDVEKLIQTWSHHSNPLGLPFAIPGTNKHLSIVGTKQFCELMYQHLLTAVKQEGHPCFVEFSTLVERDFLKVLCAKPTCAGNYIAQSTTDSDELKSGRFIIPRENFSGDSQLGAIIKKFVSFHNQTNHREH